MIVASFTSIYLPTLSTVSTLLALGTVWVARQERRDERSEVFVAAWVGRYERVESAILELLETAERAQHGQHEGRFEVARRRLRSAVARTDYPKLIPKATELAVAPPEEVSLLLKCLKLSIERRPPSILFASRSCPFAGG